MRVFGLMQGDVAGCVESFFVLVMGIEDERLPPFLCNMMRIICGVNNLLCEMRA